MDNNTILRIKVPAHLYESVKQQLTLNEAKAKPHYGAGMEVVKEKKMKVPKDGMKKVEEEKNEEVKEAVHDKKERSLDELKAAKEKLEKKIHEMEGAHKIEEKEKVEEYVGMSPDQQELVNILGQLIASGAAGGAIVSAARNLLDKIKGGKKEMPNEAKEEKVKKAKDEEKKEAIEEAEEFNLSKHYRAGEPRVLNNAIAIDRLIKSSVKDMSKAKELIGLIILLADAFAEQRIGQLKGDQNWQYDKK